MYVLSTGFKDCKAQKKHLVVSVHENSAGHRKSKNLVVLFHENSAGHRKNKHQLDPVHDFPPSSASIKTHPYISIFTHSNSYNLSHIPSTINNHLVTALVERWRPETHTFHLPNGECTITLEDVAYQLGLPIDGDVVTGPTSLDWEMICLNLLGAIPTDKQIIGQRIQMSWLDSTFQQLPDDANDIVIHQHARAFILRMIGSFLMPDTYGSRVHLMYLSLLQDLSETFNYSWGSAVLACLYRGLCHAVLISRQIEISGCLLLLQSWAYDRIPILAPRLHDNIVQLFPLVRR
ncbi:hypothetical protein Lal_00024344 [Lupinus albus]|nr:hypothetical protein Lal_00024344 [Lupinus albus]